MNDSPFSLAAPGVQQLKPYEPGKPVSELQRELGLQEIIKLASNENPFGSSPKAQQAAMDALQNLAEYPDGNGFALKQALAKKHHVDSAQITLGNGSNDILELVGRAFLTPEHAAVFSAHAFAVYPLVTQAIGAEMRIAPACAADSVTPFGHDLTAMQALIDARARVVFVANPNNPTGTWLRADDLYAFLKNVPDQTIVVLDEAYFEYVEEDDYPDGRRWLTEFPNLIVTRTFSKAHGLAALRVGYSLSSPEIADLLNRVRQPFNVNSVAQAAALAALDDEAHIATSRELNRQGLQQLTAACKTMGLQIIPSVANFLTIDVARPAEPVFQALLREGVIVRPIANYGLPSWLRVTVGSEQQNTQFLQALQKVLHA